MGGVHLDDIYLKENVCIYGVVDTNIERAKLFAKKYNAKSFSNEYQSYLEDENTDIILCATYPESHLEILKKCVQYKKHLLCEKPITPDLASAQEFVKIVKEADIKVQVGYILRYNKTYQKVADMIHKGMIGHPLIIRMVQNHHVVNWQKYRALLSNASPIVDCGVHYVDICHWFTGAKVEEISGISSTIDEETPEGTYNYGLITIKLTDGSIAYYEAGWGGTIAASNIKEFIGPKGRIRIMERDNRPENKEEGDLIEFYDKEKGEYITINVDAVRRPTGDQLQNLIDMIENNKEAVPNIDEVYESFYNVILADEKLKK